MTNDIQKFDITTHIRGKVREAIVSSVPDEQIDAMIQAEYDAFFKPKREYNRETPSPFAVLVKSEIEALIKERLTQWLNINFQQHWDDTGTQKMVGDLVAEFVPVVQARMAYDITQSALNEIKNLMQRGY